MKPKRKKGRACWIKLCRKELFSVKDACWRKRLVPDYKLRLLLSLTNFQCHVLGRAMSHRYQILYIKQPFNFVHFWSGKTSPSTERGAIHNSGFFVTLLGTSSGGHVLAQDFQTATFWFQTASNGCARENPSGRVVSFRGLYTFSGRNLRKF